jgi:hypothetical protein
MLKFQALITSPDQIQLNWLPYTKLDLQKRKIFTKRLQTVWPSAFVDTTSFLCSNLMHSATAFYDTF